MASRLRTGRPRLGREPPGTSSHYGWACSVCHGFVYLSYATGDRSAREFSCEAERVTHVKKAFQRRLQNPDEIQSRGNNETNQLSLRQNNRAAPRRNTQASRGLKLLHFGDVQQGTVGDAFVNTAFRPLFGYANFDRPGGDQGLIRMMNMIRRAVTKKHLERDKRISVQMSSNFCSSHRLTLIYRPGVSTPVTDLQLSPGGSLTSPRLSAELHADDSTHSSRFWPFAGARAFCRGGELALLARATARWHQR